MQNLCIILITILDMDPEMWAIKAFDIKPCTIYYLDKQLYAFN